MSKFDSKADEAILLGYSLTSKAYRIFNRRTLNVEESVHVVFDEIVDLEENPLESNKTNGGDEEYFKEAFDEMYLNENPLTKPEDLAKSWKSPRGLSLENVIGDISKGVEKYVKFLYDYCFCFTDRTQKCRRSSSR